MPETRGQALETIGESFINHRANVSSWAPVRVLRNLASRVGRRGGASSSESSAAVSVAERSVERLESVENIIEPSVSSGLGQEEAEEVGTPVSEDEVTPVGAMNSNEEEIELGILAVPAPA